MLNAPALANLRHAPNLCGSSAAARSVHFDFLGNELTKILVWSHHEDFKSGFLRFLRERPNDVVGLVARHTQMRNVQGLQHLVDDGDCGFDAFGGFVAVGFVGREGRFAGFRSANVKNHRQVRRPFFFQDVHQGEGKSIHGRSVQSRGGHPRILRKGNVGTEN